MTKRYEIFFQTTKSGKRRAYRWERMQFRSFPIAMDRAEMLIATEQAVVLDGHPMRPRPIRDHAFRPDATAPALCAACYLSPERHGDATAVDESAVLAGRVVRTVGR